MSEHLQAPNMVEASWLSLGGLCALGFGLRVCFGSSLPDNALAKAMTNDAYCVNIKKLTLAYALTALFQMIGSGFMFRLGGLSQLLVPLFSLKWVVLFALFYSIFTRKQGYFILVCTLSVEVLLGLTTAWSQFKEPLFVFVLVCLVRWRFIQRSVKFGLGIVFLLGFALSVFWTSVKMDYRSFLRGNPTKVARLEFLAGRASVYGSYDFSEGAMALASRVTYTSLFGHTLAHVPSKEPHSNGALWLGAVRHVLMPRLLFKNKEITDDSSRAIRFTGLRLAGAESYTSIGIGYFAESYADFGRIGMFVPIFIVGLLIGVMHYVISGLSGSSLLANALGATLVFTQLGSFGTSNMKILGGLIVHFIVFWVLWRQFGETFLRWVKDLDSSCHFVSNER